MVMPIIRLELMCLNLDLVPHTALVSGEGKRTAERGFVRHKRLKQPNDGHTLASTYMYMPHPRWRILACHPDQIFGRPISFYSL